MDWKQILPGIIIGAILGMASTFFIFQGRISKLEAIIQQSNINPEPRPKSQSQSKSNEDWEIIIKDNNISIEITNPQNDDEINQQVIMEGNFQGDLGSYHLWIVLNPIGSSGWWPQLRELRPHPESGKWSLPVTVGSKNDIGKQFELAIIMADNTVNDTFKKYIETSNKTGSFPETPLPTGGFKFLQSIVVVRK